MPSRTTFSQTMKTTSSTAHQSFHKRIHNHKHHLSLALMDSLSQTSPHSSSHQGNSQTAITAPTYSSKKSGQESMPTSRLSYAQSERQCQSSLVTSWLECRRRSSKENCRHESMTMKRSLSPLASQRISLREERCSKTSSRP